MRYERPSQRVVIYSKRDYASSAINNFSDKSDWTFFLRFCKTRNVFDYGKNKLIKNFFRLGFERRTLAFLRPHYSDQRFFYARTRNHSSLYTRLQAL